MRARLSRPSPRVLLASIAGFLVILILYGYWVGWAGSAEEPSGDAVIAHAGQRHRLRVATELMEDGAAPVLVILFAEEAFPRDHQELCQDRETFTVLCPKGGDVDTLGEAVVIAELAREYDWDSAVIVTSNYHLRRAGYLDRKCADIEILGVGARPKNLPIRMRGVFKEMLAMPLALGASCQ